MSSRRFRGIEVQRALGEPIERGIEHAHEVVVGIADDAIGFLVPQHRHRDATAVGRIGGRVRLAQEPETVNGSVECPGPSRNAHPRSSRSGSTTVMPITSSSFLSFRTMIVRCAHGQAHDT